MNGYHKDLVELLRSIAGADPKVEIPPQAFVHLQGKIIDHDPNKSFQCAFPVLPEHGGLPGSLSAGTIAAAVENTFQLFALLTARRSCMTVNLSLSHIRAIEADAVHYVVEARLREGTRHVLFMDAKIVSKDGRTCATAAGLLSIPKDGKQTV
jgi:acyl-coenzyme A thioesterase PaaI-like protein